MPSRRESAGVGGARRGLSHNGAISDGRVRVDEIQRARLLSAMVQVTCEHGFADATVARVVAHARVSRRTFYELFEDREACFLAALDEGVARASLYVPDMYDSNAKWTERVRVALAALLQFLDAEGDTARLLVIDSLGAGSRALECRRRVLAQIIAVVDEGRAEAKTGSVAPSLTAEAVVGGVLSVLHARLLETDRRPLIELGGPLMSVIVLPYLGPAAARRELERPMPKPRVSASLTESDPLSGLGMRLTYRTVRVLTSVAAAPGSSNRQIGAAAGVPDQGQMSKLLGRLERLGLIRNEGLAPGKGGPNSWILTDRGARVERVMHTDTDHRPISTSAQSHR